MLGAFLITIIGFPAFLIGHSSLNLLIITWCFYFTRWTFSDITQSVQADENLRLELEEDVKEECTKVGPVDSVKVTGLYALKDKQSCFSFLFLSFLSRFLRNILYQLNQLSEKYINVYFFILFYLFFYNPHLDLSKSMMSKV